MGVGGGGLECWSGIIRASILDHYDWYKAVTLKRNNFFDRGGSPKWVTLMLL